MAYINVADWTSDQVTDWLKGLDDYMYGYLYPFTNNEVGGKKLLSIRHSDLEQLGMKCIGHQEIVLEAVENLRNFHYHLKNDNLQFMALHVATAAHNLHRQLAQNHSDVAKIETRSLHDITRTIATIKPLISWLERSPFRRQDQYREICRNMLRLGLELATIAQRDRFVERPAAQIRTTAEKLERLANYIIQDISDPMVLQPAALNLVTLKKRESELGFNIESSYNGTHRVIDIKYNSPAHNSGKIEDGDEIVQINYQTVVGWQHKTVLAQLREALPDVVLTVKKRPKHTKMYGQIYMQPYRLPSKKRTMAGRWGENLPSPRAGFLTLAHDTDTFKLPEGVKSDEKATTAASSDTDSSCSDILTPTDTKSPSKEIRLYYPKPRAMLQRRNTICGDEILSLKHIDLEVPTWHDRKQCGVVCDPGSPSLRDKSVSFGFGLEIAPRPTTCIGIASGGGKFTATGTEARTLFHEGKKFHQLEIASESYHELSLEQEDKYKPGVKVVRFDANMKVEDYKNKNEKYTCNVENTILETFEPIPFADEGDEDALEMIRNFKTEKAIELAEAIDIAMKGNETLLVEAINTPLLQSRRGRLDKSHSTPAYDNSGEESSTPPAIEPRKEFLLVTPPIPPPRPRKQKELTPPAVPPPPPKPANLLVNAYPAAQKTENMQTEVNELHTPTKSRTLTLKKKNSLIAKRRNINLKILGTGDIQGHLYRRKKDHRGVTYWSRVYFVMLDTILYGFRTKQSSRASCVIFLPGFTVSIAKEVHSKPFAFKVYHTAKTFYFAAESQDALTQWVEFLQQASVQIPAKGVDSSATEIKFKELFSENDSSEEENNAVVTNNLCTPSPQGAKDINLTFSASNKSATTPTSSTSRHDIMGSLRKLTNTFKSNSAKASSDIPVPTEQYRSYRKVPGGSFGIQIGANTPGYHDPVMAPVLTPVSEPTHAAPKLSRSSSRSSIVSNTESSASLGLGPPASPAPTLSSIHQPPTESPTKSLKKIPHGFLHASIPNLVDFDFQTSKTLEYSLPKMNASAALDTTLHHNTQGFVTLKDLMLRKQEEEAQEMYNNRVLLGVEKKYGQHKRTESTTSKQNEQNMQQQQTASGAGEKLSKTQSRSLPKTPDYEISFKPDDEDIKRTRTKEGLKLRDFGYELISGDEPITSDLATSRQNSYNSHTGTTFDYRHEQPQTSGLAASVKSRQFSNFLHKSTKKQSTGSVSFSTESGGDKRTGSIKKKGKNCSDRLFQFHKHLNSSNQVTPPANAMTMTLPLNKKSKSNHALERITGFGGNIRKSQTYNQDLKEKASGRYDAQRKNSAPIPIFAKFTSLSTSTSGSTHVGHSFCGTKTSKEKRLLCSPLLHRTIFGHHQNLPMAIPTTPPISADQDCDQEIFTQVIFPPHNRQQYSESSYKYRDTPSIASSKSNICTPLPPALPPPNAAAKFTASAESTTTTMPKMQSSNSNDSKAATPDYPNMECPPVFEPEIYSLTEPNISMTLLMRRNNNSGAGEEK